MRSLKKICIIASLVLFCVVAVALLNKFYWNKEIEIREYSVEDYGGIQEFSIREYTEELEIFSSDKNVGAIENVDDVIRIAQELWNEKYGRVGWGRYDDPNPGNSIEVFFDAEEECWLVRGTVPPDPFPPDNTVWTGVLPYVAIRENGEVLAIWME